MLITGQLSSTCTRELSVAAPRGYLNNRARAYSLFVKGSAAAVDAKTVCADSDVRAVFEVYSGFYVWGGTTEASRWILAGPSEHTLSLSLS